MLRRLVDSLRAEGLPVKVITAPRHGIEEDQEESLVDFLMNRNVEHIVVSDIKQPAVADFLGRGGGRVGDSFYLSLGAAWIFETEVIEELFGGLLFNLHGTRLPENRGGGGFSWQIMMGNRLGSCTLHRVDGGVDTGEVVSAVEFVYPGFARIPADFEAVQSDKAHDLVCEFVSWLRQGSQFVKGVAQSEMFSSYWPRLNTAISGLIDWSMSPHEIERFICAFDSPYRGASTFLNGQKVYVKSVQLTYQDGLFHSYQSGLIYRKSKDWICVALNGGTLIVEKLEDGEGRDVLGVPRVGDRLATPAEMLEKAKERISYSPVGRRK